MNYLILFDIDGTILKLKTYYSREIFSQVLRDFFLKEIKLDDTVSFKGKTDLEILRLIAEQYQLDYKEIKNNLDEIWGKLLSSFQSYYVKENFKIITGIDKFLKLLSERDNILLGLQTGNFKQNAIQKLKVFGFEKYFITGAYGSDFEDRTKLPPLAIKRANEFLGKNIFSEKNTLIIGDSESDIICAKSNNLPIILVNSDNSYYEQNLLDSVNLMIRDYKNPDYIINSIFKIFKNYEEN